MDDLKKLSVERLRDLARRHLGKGHTRLRTKAQLIEALKEALRGTLHRLEEAVESVVKGVKVVDSPPGRRGRVRGGGGTERAHAARPPDEAARTGTTRRTSTPSEPRETASGRGGAGPPGGPPPPARPPSRRPGAPARAAAR